MNLRTIGFALLVTVMLIPFSNARADTFTYSESMVTYTISTTGTYLIDAFGAQGGLSRNVAAGGAGAEVSGEIYLTAGTVLDIIVGGQGGEGGGGGGSFVWEQGGSQPLIIAGGGGGGGYLYAGGVGQTGTSGADSGGAGGVSGAGGSGDGGGGGGGWSGNGSAGALGAGGGYGAFDPTNPFDGGSAGLFSGPGGFGGGGGGGYHSGGGGGGYSGGGGGDDNAFTGGGGGGSYLDSSFTDVETSTSAGTTLSYNFGNGDVTIEQTISQPVPEPSSLLLLGSGLFGLAGTLKRRLIG